MNLGLGGHVAVIMGGARGIGRAIGAGFAAEGAIVVLVDRDTTVEDSATALSGVYPGRVHSRTVDVGHESDMTVLATELSTTFGRIDHVAFAAAIGSGRYGFPAWNLAADDWRRVLEVNLVGAAITGQVFGPLLARQQGGTMLFLASIAGQTGSQTDPPYSASKAGVINLAQCLAKDLAPHGVRVNTICPGSVRTALHRSVWQAWRDRQQPGTAVSYEDWARQRVAQIPLGRWQDPEDIADLAVFLASVRAKNITGQTLNVDGGAVMHS
jgi:NAD(P)-dependent dehydrogenase (short-subunit alcohol dehydrogenase family)